MEVIVKNQRIFIPAVRIQNFLRRQLSILAILFFALFSVSSVTAISDESLHSIINDTPWYAEDEEAECVGANFSGDDARQISFNFFVSQGLTTEQSAGIVGNLLLESAGTLDPNINQEGGGPGRGIAQWTVTERWQTLLQYAADNNKDPLTLELQLEFIWHELQDPRNGLAELQATTSIEEATRVFMDRYERPGTPHFQGRLDYAMEVHTAFAGSAPGATPTSSGAGGCPTGPGIGGIDRFPLNTTKAQIQAGVDGAVWNHQATSNYHHNYNAADIHVVPGVEVVAAAGGEVVGARDRLGGVGSTITIRGGDGEFTYFYSHMEFGSLTVSRGDQVTPGQVIAQVGVSTQAENRPPHLHFDMLPQSEHDTRPSCSSAACSEFPFIDVQPILKELYDRDVPD